MRLRQSQGRRPQGSAAPHFAGAAGAAARLRLYKRSGKTVGAVLRDGRALRQAFTGGFDDKEVAVQELHATSNSATTHCCGGSGSAPTARPAPPTLVARGGWPAELLDALAAARRCRARAQRGEAADGGREDAHGGAAREAQVGRRRCCRRRRRRRTCCSSATATSSSCATPATPTPTPRRRRRRGGEDQVAHRARRPRPGGAGRGAAARAATSPSAAAARPEHALKIHTCFDDAAGGGSASGA